MVDLSLYLQETLRQHAAMQVELDNSLLERNRLSTDLATVCQEIDMTVKQLEDTQQLIDTLQQQLQDTLIDNERLQNTN